MPRSALKKWFVGCSLFLIALAILLAIPRSLPPAPVVRPAQTPGALRVSAGPSGALFVLPDGSLWQWGTATSPDVRDRMPAQYGTNFDWASAACSYDGMVGVKTNGTLWRSWFQMGAGVAVTPHARQVGTGTNWAVAVRNNLAIAALQQDGTLQTVGASVAYDSIDHGALGDPTIRVRTEPGPVGNLRWRCLADDTPLNGFIGITTDGRLMAWGRASHLGPVLPVPSPFAPGTNWVSASQHLYLDHQGRLWFRPRNPSENLIPPAEVPLQLLRTNASPGRFGTTLDDFFEIRSDGSLWRGRNPVYPPTAPGAPPSALEAMARCGNRNDWRRLWSGGGTLYGLTAEGTLWVIGLDHGRGPVPNFAERTEEWVREVMRVFTGRTRFTASGTLRAIREPQPLLRIVVPDGTPLRVEEATLRL